jgi:ribosomal protein S26
MKDEIVTSCDRCSKPIPKGNAYVCIYRSIEQIEHNIAENQDEVQVIDAEIIIALCGNCGNKFDTAALHKLVQLIPYDPVDTKKN